MLPKEYGSGSTCHRRFQEWRESDIFYKLWKIATNIRFKERNQVELAVS